MDVLVENIVRNGKKEYLDFFEDYRQKLFDVANMDTNSLLGQVVQLLKNREKLGNTESMLLDDINKPGTLVRKLCIKIFLADTKNMTDSLSSMVDDLSVVLSRVKPYFLVNDKDDIIEELFLPIYKFGVAFTNSLQKLYKRKDFANHIEKITSKSA